MIKKSQLNHRLIISGALLIFTALGIAAAARTQNINLIESLTAGLLRNDPTPTPTPPQRKQKSKRVRDSLRQTSALTGNAPEENSLLAPLATTEFNLIGLAGTVAPATQTVPKNIATAVNTSIQIPEGEDPAAIIAELNPNYRIRGELVGPSLTAPLTIEARIGSQLPIPALQNVGDHLLQNLRIVDVTDAAGATVAPVVPDSCGITVIERVLVTQVQVNQLTYEQIVQAGINLNSSNYNFYNFTIGLGTSSGTVPIQIPVAMPTTGGQPPVVGSPQSPTGVNGVNVPDIVPVMLEIDQNQDGQPDGNVELPGGQPMQIPGVVVFPGRIGLLHQFFEAIVIVANGAPNNTPLVITNLRAKAKLPDAGTPNNPTDDPLRIAQTQQGGIVSELDIHGLGADGTYGTADDTVSFNPGQSGQATFLLEGLREGLHTVNFDLQGTLNGLPVGPVNIVGSVPGAVLVRDARFGITFTHPSVVRSGQEYDLGVTVFNSGQTSINGITLNLGSNSISGATLLDTPEKTITQTIPRGGSATIKWRLQSNTNGAVTASYVKVGSGIEAGLRLITGVGDRNVPLSPDSLVLPEPVRHLPSNVVEAGRQMLGQAWSVANAPIGTLPPGVLPVDKQTVVSKAVEMGWAGLRTDFGEDQDLTLQTLLRDWLGENQINSSTGFADAIRNTPAGYYFYDVIGNRFYESLQTLSATEFHQKLIKSEAGRSAFVSALITQEAGNPVFKAKLSSPTNQSVGWDSSGRFGDVRTAASIDLLENDPNNSANNSRGKLLVASKPAAGNWSLELFGTTDGTADVSILAPTTGKNYRQLVFAGISFNNGKHYRITFKNNGTQTPVAEEYINGNYQSINLPYTIAEINEPLPEVVNVVQITPEVIEGGDRFGRLVGVLYSKPMTKSSVETLNRYTVGGGELASDTTQIIGKSISVTGASQNFGGRFSILALDAPVGPYINRNLTVNGAVDTSGKAVLGLSKNIEMRVSPQGNPAGGYLTGRVMNADGTGVPNAKVFYQTNTRDTLTGFCGTAINLTTIAAKNVDVNGDYVIDYVIDGICSPVTLLATNPSVNATKVVTSNVAYDGQHITLNAVFLARGNVQGTVSNNGTPIVNAAVSIIPELDVLNVKTVRTDAQGKYAVSGIPVGGFTVKAVGDGIYSLASGIAGGSITQAGQTVTVNVSTQDISGSISGKVLDLGSTQQTPIPNSLVVAYASIAGFPGDGAIPVGYAFTKQDGSFTITGLPITNIYLSALDPQRGVSASLNVALTPQNKQAEGVLLQISNGFGRVLGRVLNELGQPLPNAYVQEGSQTIRADATGSYVLPRVREGNVFIAAIEPLTGHRGSTTISVRRGEDTVGADIIIRRPANLNGQVFISENGTTQPLAQVYVTVDGRTVSQTDGQGRYTLNAVASGYQTIRFVYPSRRQVVNTNVFLNPGETLTRNATFRPSKIHGRITQPDGVTPAAATVNLSTVVPSLGQNYLFGLASVGNLSVQSNADGEFTFNNLNPGLFRVTASNLFFPTPVSKSGNLLPNGDPEINLSLVETLTGKIHGHIYQPDGQTRVGAGIVVSLGNGSQGDASVVTNSEGYYEFADVFSEGNYDLIATDPITGKTNRKGIFVLKNQDVTADLRLLGLGKLKVKTIDANNNSVPGGNLTIIGNGYPNQQRFIELTPVFNGEYLFTDLSEGNYSISAFYNGLGGRTSANVTLNGTTEVIVQIEAVGTVSGKVYMPDGTTPVGLADVSISQNGRTVGFMTSDDSEEDRGKFVFQGVRTGSFTLDVFDNRTGRRGRSFGQLTQQGQVVSADVRLLALGTVTGTVTSNGVPAVHALVTIDAGPIGQRTVRTATTDAEGKYRFTGIPVGEVTVSVTNGPGGLTGYASGTVSGTAEPLPDTIINVALTPTAAFIGTVYKFGGTEIYPGASVFLKAGTLQFVTVADLNGKYRFDFVPLGNYEIRVAAPFGYDFGRSTVILSDQPGATITTDITMTGVGNITGLALDSNGAPLTFGKVEFTNNAWGDRITIEVPVQSNGTFSLLDLPTGDFNLKLTVPDRIGVGAVNGTLNGNQTINTNLQLEPAGKIFGTLKAIDGTTAVVGGDAVLTLTKQNGNEFTFVTRTDAQGNWEFSNIPLGNISISFTDPNSEGFARLSGLTLSVNGQELDAGTVVLSNSNLTVVSVNPPDGAINVPTNSNIQINFSEPVDPSSINSASIRLVDNFSIPKTLTISADRKTVTVTPNSLRQMINYTVEVTSFVKNQNGAPIQFPFVSTFRTADETAPYVSAVTPIFNSNQIPLNSNITVTFDEPLGENQEFSDIIRVTPANPPGALLTGVFEISTDRKTVNFAPTGLAGNTRYQISVFGQKDVAGNVQNTVYTSNFSTIDTILPVISEFKIDNQTANNGLIVTNATPQFLANFSDNLAVNRNETKLYLAKQGQPLQAVSTAQTVSLLNYYPPQPLPAGQYVTKLVVKDLAGNETSTPEFTFTMDPQLPDILYINPGEGSMSGNTVLTITGRNLVTQTVEPDENARGLYGEYAQVYNGDRRFSRIDDEIDFELFKDSFTPYFPDGNQVGVVWKGKVIPRFSEQYTFTSQHSGFAKLTINGQTVIDGVGTENVSEYSGTVSLVAGQAYDIVFEHSPLFFESGTTYGKNHVVKLFWASASQTREIVPNEQLRPSARPLSPTVLVGGQAATVIGVGKTNFFDQNDLVTVLTPAGSEGIVPVEVQNSNGSDVEQIGFNYIFDVYAPQAINFSINENSPGRISVYFDEPLSPNQNLANVLKVYSTGNGNAEVSGSVTLDETGLKLTFVPTSPFVENVIFRVAVVNQEDLSGNAAINVEERFFTLDRTAPEIYDITPNGGNVDTTNPLIKVFYRDGLSPITGVALTVDGNNVTDQLSRYESYFEYRTFPAMELGEHTYTARVTDEDGNFAERSGSFTVVNDTSAPIINYFQIDGKEAVEGLKINQRSPLIEVNFRDTGGNIPFEQRLFFGAQGSELSLVSTSVGQDQNGFVIYRYIPQQAYGLYSARVELTDSLGNSVVKTVNFEITDVEIITPQVYVVSANPSAQYQTSPETVLSINFSGQIAANQNFADLVKVYDYNLQNGSISPVSGNYVLNPEGTNLTFTPDSPFLANKFYYYSAEGYRDPAGNVGQYYSSYFATTDTLAPVLRSATLRTGDETIELADAQTTVATPNIDIGFSDNLMGVDPNSAIFTLDGTNISVTAQGENFTYAPAEPLTLGSHTITFQVADYAGNIGQVNSYNFQILEAPPEMPRMPFSVENDTVLLWHLDDLSYDGSTTDASPYLIHTVPNSSTATPVNGRFAGGAENPKLLARNDGGNLAFGSNGFTVEAWLKFRHDAGSPPAAPVTIWSRSVGSQRDFSLVLLTNGDLQARVYNSNNVVWETVLPKTVFNAGDNKWHSIAMTVERGSSESQNQLKIYADGELRMASQAPPGFGSVRNTGGRFRMAADNSSFIFKADEIRISKTAHSAEQIRRNYEITEMGLVALRSLPSVIQRGVTSEVTVEGYNFGNINAVVTNTDGSLVGATVAVTNQTANSAQLSIAVDELAMLGEVVLKISSETQTATLPLRIVDQKAFTADTGTVLLWHGDETDYGNVADSGPLGINGQSYGQIVTGRFGNAKGSTIRSASNLAPLNFGNNSFTVEGWFMGSINPYTNGILNVFSKGALENGSEVFSLQLLDNGRLRARVYDSGQRVWETLTVPGQLTVADNRWHYLAMVVQRGAQPNENRLSIFVDGIETSSAQIPAQFTDLKVTSGEFFAGNDAGSSIDEIRVLNFARTSAQISTEWNGGTLNLGILQPKKAASTGSNNFTQAKSPPLTRRTRPLSANKLNGSEKWSNVPPKTVSAINNR